MIKKDSKGTTVLDQPLAGEKKRVYMSIAWFETTLIILGLLGIFFLLPHVMWWPDAGLRFEALSELFLQGKIPTTKYSLVGPLFSIPFWYLDIVNNTYWWSTRYNVVIFSLGLLATYCLLKSHVPSALLRKFFLLLIVASMFSHHLLFYYGEVFTAIFVAVGCIIITVYPGIIGWSSIILGVVNTPATLPGLILLDTKCIFANRRIRYVLAIIIAAALIMLESWIRRGSLFSSGYTDDHGARTIMPYSGQSGFSTPFFFGLLSLLFSFGKGLIFFAPGLLLPIRQTLQEVEKTTKGKLFTIYTLWVSFLIGLLLTYSCWWAWYGGWFWGPRFLLIASIPASLAIAVRLQWRSAPLWMNLLTILVLCLSLWVGIDGAIYGDEALRQICTPPWEGNEPLCYYTPEFSVLWYPFVAYQPLNGGQLLYLLYSLIVGLYLLLPLLCTTGKQIIEIARQRHWTRFRLHF